MVGGWRGACVCACCMCVCVCVCGVSAACICRSGGGGVGRVKESGRRVRTLGNVHAVRACIQEFVCMREHRVVSMCLHEYVGSTYVCVCVRPTHACVCLFLCFVCECKCARACTHLCVSPSEHTDTCVPLCVQSTHAQHPSTASRRAPAIPSQARHTQATSVISQAHHTLRPCATGGPALRCTPTAGPSAALHTHLHG